MLNFFSLLAEHVVWYLICVTVVLTGLCYLLRRYIFSLIDPLFFFLVINESFCIAEVLFMWHFRMIDQRVTLNYVLTETAMIAGVLQFRPRPREEALVPPPGAGIPRLSFRVLYQLSLALFVALHLLVYAERGIPVLQDTRLSIYQSTGWGIVDRAFDVLLVIIVYYLIDLLRRRRWMFAEWMSLLVVVTIELLSGAKIAVLEIFFIAGLASYFMGTHRRFFSLRSRAFLVSVLVAVAAALAVVTIQSRNSVESGLDLSPVDSLVLRLVASGDAFVYAYPENFVTYLDGSHPVSAVLKEYLAFFRLVPDADLPAHIGVQLSQYFTGNGSMFQTNAKPNLFGLVYFGFWGSIVYSYLTGSLIGLVRCTLMTRLPRHWIGGIIFALLSLGTIELVNETDAANRYVIDTIFVFLPLVVLASAIAAGLKARPVAAETGLSSGAGEEQPT
jgi:hypothetical protein